ncbi:Solute carrier family 40 protein, partial [Trichostrongylus colubriformis]
CLSLETSSPWFTVFLVLGILTCAVNRLFLNAEKFLLSRDWVVVLSDGDTLSSFNATLTALDQLTNVISPIITGVLVTAWDLQVTCAIFGAFSLVSMASKALLLRALYIRQPKLAHKERKEAEQKGQGKTGVVAVLESIPDVLRTYFRQTVIAAAFGMALLFMTVMGFDGLAVGYGQSAGLSDFVLGAFRSYGSAMGILGALSYAFVERRLGVRKAGLLGLTCQQICLIVAVISIWLPGSPFDPQGYFHGRTTQSPVSQSGEVGNAQSLDSIITFLSGIATARFEIMNAGVRKLVETHYRFQIQDVLVIILPDPSTFGICILISYGFVTSGYLSFVYYLIKHPPPEKQGKLSEGNDQQEEIRL